ncbi:MAG: hypothetical protein M1827_003943 [Pycnora praestabilis]|nr:MAG: hypothetical protein M1827_003943 [Pycnora praestabilis]
MSAQYENCTSVTPECPVSATIYGYYPSLGANAFFLAFFAITTGIQVFQGLRWKNWTFMLALVLGAGTEAIGYIGRVLMHNNPWQNAGFETQICCLIIAPAFISAGIYLTLKHLVITFGEDLSRIQPKYYTWFFISCDMLALILQGIGGGLAASSNGNDSQRNTGTDLMLAGIAWQVATLLIFGLLAGDYFIRVYHHRDTLNPETTTLRNTLKFKLFLTGLTIAFVTVFTRCIYRLPEMSGGWENSIMQNQTEFIVLDGVMCTIAVLALTVFHPGFCFKNMRIQSASHKSSNEKPVLSGDYSSDPEMGAEATK